MPYVVNEEITIVGDSPKMTELFGLIDVYRRTSMPVLVEGPTGTGKLLVAKALHYTGDRKDRRFVEVSCGELPETLMESELFGHERGAFTGAMQSRKGFFEEADGGTLLLNDVDALNREAQPKLLAATGREPVYRVGGRTPIRADVRIICTTNGDVANLRKDLFYRISGVHITLPSLAERREDIPGIVEYLQGRATRKLSKQPVFFRNDIEKLMSYPWPGNVRELENYIEASVVFGVPQPLEDIRKTHHDEESGYATARDLDPPIGSGLTLAEVERRYILRTLLEKKGNRAETRRTLGISVSSLQYRLREYGLPVRGSGRMSYKDAQAELSLIREKLRILEGAN